MPGQLQKCTESVRMPSAESKLKVRGELQKCSESASYGIGIRTESEQMTAKCSERAVQGMASEAEQNVPGIGTQSVGTTAKVQ